MAVADRVRELVTPVVEAEGAELYDVEHTGGVLRVFVTADDGLEIGTIQRISRAVSRLLDEADPMPGRYTLEVSSPGLERPLRTPDHYRSAIGSDVKVKLGPHVEGDRRVSGVLRSADDTGFELDVDGTPRRVDYTDVTKSRTVFEWGPTPRRGGDKGAKNESTRKATTS